MHIDSRCWIVTPFKTNLAMPGAIITLGFTDTGNYQNVYSTLVPCLSQIALQSSEFRSTKTTFSFEPVYPMFDSAQTNFLTSLGQFVSRTL